jgi:hypothetical protein
MPSLAEFQSDFAAALRRPAAGHALRDAEPAGLRVHRNTVMKALIDAVLANYPTVGVLAGVEWLSGVARDYALRHPPRHAVLAEYGESFPDFLRAMDADLTLPYLGGVAELDRAWTQSLLAPDAPALDPARLHALSPQALASLRLQLHPSARYGVYGHSAVTVWRASRPPAVPPTELQIDGGDEAALIVRNSGGVVLLPLDVGAQAFLEVIVAGGNTAAAASAALQADPDADIAVAWTTFLVQGTFAKFELDGD